MINVVSALFIGEAGLKILVSGFYFGENTYLKDPWNILDFVIVFFSVLTWLLEVFLGTSISFIVTTTNTITFATKAKLGA